MERHKIPLSMIMVGEKYFYQGANTMESGQLYEAEVVGIYRHHIVLLIQPVKSDDSFQLYETKPYTWSITKVAYGRTEHLYRRDI